MAKGWRHLVLKPQSLLEEYFRSADRPKQFCEPTLVRRPKVYAEFLARLDQAGMLTWRRGGDSLLGVFFVAKKNGKIRIILDTRD
eukprot:6285342-Karenia_brevis.AAC.1